MFDVDQPPQITWMAGPRRAKTGQDGEGLVLALASNAGWVHFRDANIEALAHGSFGV
jgi:hypothetical protein